MIDVEEALRILGNAAPPRDVVELGLAEAQGLVLARSVAADRDFPPTDRSAMDGFAVRTDDIHRAGVRLDVAGELRAGQPLGATRVDRGSAVRIMTGAIVPPGADAVVMVEHTEESSGKVRIDSVPRIGQHIRRRAEDLEQGAVALQPGVPIDAASIAALASVGCIRVAVHRAPRVHVLSTGDEVVEPEKAPADHQVRNSNAHALLAQLREASIEGRYLGIAGDDPAELARLLAKGLAGDLLLVTGGVSAGAYDLVVPSLAEAGMQQLFHKVAVKPGKPLLAGLAGACLVVGLPGNPVSTFTTFRVFVLPALRRMMGYQRWRDTTLCASLETPLTATAGRRTYHLARLEATAQGLTARRLQSRGSGDVLALARANGFIVTGESGAQLPAGAAVDVIPWGPIRT